MESLHIDGATRVLVLTGAGVSAESGIPTFRASGGLWESHRVEDVASRDGFVRDPLLVWRFYSQRRAGVLAAQPNAGHRALAALEARLGDRFLLATQNIDGLHARAGSERVIELHGNLLKTRCLHCDREPFEDLDVYTDRVPGCGLCHASGRPSILRPHIVWFGELLDRSHLQRIETFIDDGGKNLVFLAVGTSGAVYPAAGLVSAARSVGATTWLVNLDDADNSAAFDHVVRGRSGQVLPALFAA